MKPLQACLARKPQAYKSHGMQLVVHHHHCHLHLPGLAAPSPSPTTPPKLPPKVMTRPARVMQSTPRCLLRLCPPSLHTQSSQSHLKKLLPKHLQKGNRTAFVFLFCVLVMLERPTCKKFTRTAFVFLFCVLVMLDRPTCKKFTRTAFVFLFCVLVMLERPTCKKFTRTAFVFLFCVLVMLDRPKKPTCIKLHVKLCTCT